MPFRRVPTPSDRGNIRDIQNGDDDQFPPTEQELRIKELYEHALVTKDQALMDSLGLIAFEGSPRDPIAIHKHREYVNSLKAKIASQVEQTAQEIEGCVPTEGDMPDEAKWARYKQAASLEAILQEEEFVKVADAEGEFTRSIRSFRRAKQS